MLFIVLSSSVFITSPTLSFVLSATVPVSVESPCLLSCLLLYPYQSHHKYVSSCSLLNLIQVSPPYICIQPTPILLHSCYVGVCLI
jgi:hypothetical protein